MGRGKRPWISPEVGSYHIVTRVAGGDLLFGVKEKEQFVATGQLSADVQVHLIHYETLTLVQSA